MGVRIFDIQHIKGLEFEAVFFVGIDEVAERLPGLFDNFLYVGVSRAATYLGLSYFGRSSDTRGSILSSPSTKMAIDGNLPTVRSISSIRLVSQSAKLATATRNDLLFIFIASHGAPDPSAPKNLYFLLHDSKVADMPNTALPMEELRDSLDNLLHAQRAVVLVDTCHSAGLRGTDLVTTRALENNLINLYTAKLYNEKGRALLTSSDINELSQEGERWGGGHGVFTYTLLEGLKGAADSNNDNIITAGELFSYVRQRVRAETDFQQNPTALPGLNQNLRLAVATSRRR